MIGILSDTHDNLPLEVPMPHPINRRQKPAWKQPRRPPAPPRPQGEFPKRAPGRKISPSSKPR